MKTFLLIRKIWLVVAIIILVVSLLLFTGAKESETAGNLVFSMLVLGFPSSVIAYPTALAVSDLFSSSNMFAYNSRLVLSVWWLIFFIFGTCQWFTVPWLIKRVKTQPAGQPDRVNGGGADAENS